MNKSFASRLTAIAATAGTILIFVIGSASIGSTGAVATRQLRASLSACSTDGPVVTFKVTNNASAKAQFVLTTKVGDSIVHTYYNVKAGTSRSIPRTASSSTTVYTMHGTAPNLPSMLARTWVLRPATCRIVRAN
jgi:hypothetical protein